MVAPIFDDAAESDIVEGVTTETDFRAQLSFSAKDCLVASMPKIGPGQKHGVLTFWVGVNSFH